MATYTITHPKTGKKLSITGESEPTKEQLDEIFKGTEGDSAIAAEQPVDTSIKSGTGNQAKLPLIGNPLDAFKSGSPQMEGLMGGVKQGLQETEELSQAGKPIQASLHHYANLAKFGLGATGAALSGLSPRLSDLVGRAATHLSTPRQPGEESRIGITQYGMPTGDNITTGASGITIPEIQAKYPTATRIAGDVGSIASGLSAGPAIIKGVPKAAKIAKEGTGEFISDVGSNAMEAGAKSVSKQLDKHIEALTKVIPKDRAEEIGVNKLLQKRDIKKTIINNDLDKIIGNMDKNEASMEILLRSAEASKNLVKPVKKGRGKAAIEKYNDDVNEYQKKVKNVNELYTLSEMVDKYNPPVNIPMARRATATGVGVTLGTMLGHSMGMGPWASVIGGGAGGWLGSKLGSTTPSIIKVGSKREGLGRKITSIGDIVKGGNRTEFDRKKVILDDSKLRDLMRPYYGEGEISPDVPNSYYEPKPMPTIKKKGAK